MNGQMHSIRTKTALLLVIAIVIGMTVVTLMAAVAIKNLGADASYQILHLLCETGAKNLDDYFESISQSVEIVSAYAEDDLAETDLKDLSSHLERVSRIFEKSANNTTGILTYYYRIDPAVSNTDKGFWYVDLDGTGFTAHEVTDITLYDTEDQSALVWFTVPKATGGAIWLPPYVTENLGVYVLSYNVPVYKDDTFVGVIGIEIDYGTIAETVDNIELYENGYAFINDDEGDIIYHPRIFVANLSGPNKPKVPEGLLSEDSYVRYTYEGVKKQAVWKPLSNGMRLNVTVPMSEINGYWHRLIIEIVIVSLLLIIVFTVLMMRLAGHITKPLRELTVVAEQVNAGNYDIQIDYDMDDEVGILTRTVKKLVSHLKTYINDLNSLAY
ncbi:MAG: cache and HAMP domain-containing protein, partial [Clostridia bacterium]|nr:cache and HAMP domain-containing protein [Clostridia bacterium]